MRQTRQLLAAELSCLQGLQLAQLQSVQLLSREELRLLLYDHLARRQLDDLRLGRVLERPKRPKRLAHGCSNTMSRLKGAKTRTLGLGKLAHRRRLVLELIRRIAVLSPITVEISRRRSGVVSLASTALEVLLLSGCR